MIYIFDIDGTLADISHRLHFIQKEPKDWHGFFADCQGDSVIREVAQVAEALRGAGFMIVLITGRSDEIRLKTSAWLRDQQISWNVMYMRKEGDHREDSVVKAELLDEVMEKHHGPILGVFEDRKQVVAMYRSKGLRVFQVAEGDF
jgi:hypothetical protein